MAEAGTEAERIARAREGDLAAWGELYDRHAPEVAQLLSRTLGPELDLEDAVQEAFLRLRERFDKLQKPASLRSYLLGIARNVALDRARSAAARGAREAQVEARRGLAPSAADEVSRAERRALAREALAAVDPELRSVLALRHLEGTTLADLAATLSCSVPTARARLREAAAQLALELRARGIDPEELRHELA
ncbi:MAG: sigma-70 family RNA polymerase sigma factor [Planctomycetota bacterium]